jgi:glycosyltransferase involved in cell wall biosynthesis
MSSTFSSGRLVSSASSNDIVRDEELTIEAIRLELADSRLRIKSLQIELLRAENDIYKVERLWRISLTENFSRNKLFKVTYLVLSCIFPDIIKWLLRPLTRSLKRGFLRLVAPSHAAAYQVKSAPNPLPQKRVLHVIANFMTGGSSRLIVDIVEGLGHTYHQSILTGFNPAPVAYHGVTVRECRNPYQIVTFLQKFRPDLIHVHYWGDVDFGWYDKVFRAAEEVGCKVVENVNTPVIPYCSPIVCEYVFVSDYVKRNFGLSLKGSIVIHPGSDFDFFSRTNTNTVDTAGNCIGMVYRLEPDKLELQSIDIFIEVVKRRPDTTVLIVGGGSYLQQFKHRVAEQNVSGSFRFTGAVPYDDLPSLYAQMSVFIAPVRKESFGQVAPFAMSMELPVAGYDVGALSEILGDSELLAPPGNFERLADIAISLLDDPARRQDIGKRNRQRARLLFSVETMIHSYEQVYRAILQECI